MKVNNVHEEIAKNFGEKLDVTMQIIDKFVDTFKRKDQVIAWSGGKDSTVILYLLKDYDIDVIFENTNIEYPETLDYVRRITDKWNLNLIETKPYKYDYWQCVNKYGFPVLKSKRHGSTTGGSPRCCYYLKERPMEIELKKHSWEVVYLGITASESHQRMIRAKTHGTCHLDKQWKIFKVKPILYWTEDDVWNFIKNKNIPYNSIYDKGFKRCGCMLCSAYIGWEENLFNYNKKWYDLMVKRGAI